MESDGPSSTARRLWHIVRAVFYMLRKGVNKRKLLMDLHVLFKRGLIAGRALGDVITSHHRRSSSGSGGGFFSAFSCRYADPAMSFYAPREIEFSCSNTPAYATKRSSRRRRHESHDVAAIARAFEILNAEASDVETVLASPSPLPGWSYGKSPAAVRQLRITDSPFPVIEEGREADSHVDVEAEEFIRRFYEQLRLQPLVPATPEPWHGRLESSGP